MKKTAYQIPELRDENNNIIQNGAFGGVSHKQIIIQLLSTRIFA